MEQSEEMKERFDGLYHKTIPLILFAPTDESKKFTKLLSSLFCSFDNMSVFNEVYNSLSSAINGRLQYDHHQETLISRFMEQYTSLNQRIRNIEGIYLEFKGMIDRIKQDHDLIIKHSRNFNKIHKKINSINFHLTSKEQNKKSSVRDVERLPISNDVIPTVSLKMGQRRIKCPSGHQMLSRVEIGDKTTCRSCKGKQFILKKEMVIE